MRSRMLSAASVVAASVVMLSGCATPTIGQVAGAPSTPPLGTAQPTPPAGDVLAQGTVMDIAGTVELCLGGVAESYPPQCSGVPLAGWSWDAVEGEESSGNVTWGAYAVQGTYDGETFASTAPAVLLALYDPMVAEDPTGGEPGAGSEEELLRIQELLPDRLGAAYLGSRPQDGWLRVQVVWDDGTWQTAADAEFGPDTVLIESALRPVE